MRLQILGLNHTTAPVEVREQVVFAGEQIGRALARLQQMQEVAEAVLLSTCNRTEFYVISSDAGCDALRNWLHQEGNLDPDFAGSLFSLDDEQAIRHIFRVACGLDSMVLGESQILGQLKDAVRDRTRVLRAKPHLIHCVRVDAEDLRSIADNGCTIAHCPSSNAKLGHGYADLSAMLNAGVVVGLGTDSVASNNRMDVLEEARLAVLIARAVHRRYDLIPAAAAIALATQGGARALGLDAEVGTLEAGKAADLAAFPLDGLHVQPMQDPESALVFATSGRGARLVVVNGEVLVQNGRLVRDIADSVETVRQAAGELRHFATTSG
jgi:hypothetical protein